MMQNKNISLLIAGVFIVGSILYLQSGKISPAKISGTSDADAIPVEVAIQNSTEGVSRGASMEASATTNTVSKISPTSITASLGRIASKKSKYERAREISTPDGFINLPEGKTDLKLVDIVGKKVILVDFWTYSCINCQRTTPYLNAWYDKYKDQGLEIVGVHTPEFDFEKNYQNVLVATQKAGIKFPVVLDNDYSTWTSYKNRYWPRKYLIDIDGFIIYDHIGEGGYAETETQIQKALKERLSVLGSTDSVKTGMVDPGIKASPEARSLETYFGSSRNTNLGSGVVGQSGTQTFIIPEKIVPGVLYLSGVWNIFPEYAETPESTTDSNQIGPNHIEYQYQAKGVYVVAGARNNQVTVIEVREDGNPIPIGAAGSDISYKNGKSYLTVKENRLYRIIDRQNLEEHLLDFIIDSPGLQVYTFTFG